MPQFRLGSRRPTTRTAPLSTSPVELVCCMLARAVDYYTDALTSTGPVRNFHAGLYLRAATLQFLPNSPV
jgi:hypothetical protein